MEESDLDLIVAGTREAITMIEGFARENARRRTWPRPSCLAHEQITEVIDLIEELRDEGRPAHEGIAAGSAHEPARQRILQNDYGDEFRETQADHRQGRTRPTRSRSSRRRSSRELVPPEGSRAKYTPAQVSRRLRTPSKNKSSAT